MGMILFVSLAFAAGLLVSLSRQVNGRLALSTSALQSSFWNHIVGFVALLAVGLMFGGLWPAGVATTPAYAFIGGSLGVVFIALGSWLVGRIGAVNTALLVIGGQMVSGVLLDLWFKAPGSILARTTGVALIIAGMVVTQRRRG
jgi:bacterial/archaeal transporter family-2 protein